MRKHLLVLLAVFVVTVGALMLQHRDTPRTVETVASGEVSPTTDLMPQHLPVTTSTTAPPPSTTTTTVKPKPRPSTTTTSAPAAAKKPASAARTSSGGGGVEAFLECVALHESHRDDTSHNSNGSGGYYGIMVSIWHSYGQSGLPYAPYASHAQQHAVALRIYADAGPRAWSTRHFCGY